MNITTLAKRTCLLISLIITPAAWAVEMVPASPQLAAKSWVLMDAASGNVLVENGGFGAQAAAPIARQVFDYYLLGLKRKDPAPAIEGPMPDAEDVSD